MWPRNIELMIGVWLAISPLIFLDSPKSLAAFNAYVCATLVVSASCFAYWERTKNARGVTAIVALWLCGRAYISAWGVEHAAPPELQNEFAVGILLLLFAIIPNRTTEPPDQWRPYVRDGS